jgi:hypothetical protein
MFKDDPEWDALIMDGGHDLMIDNPAAVTEVLLARSRGWSPRS